MRIQCPFCSYHMRGITDSMLGRKVRCPDCGKTNHLGKDPFQSGRILGDFIIKRCLGGGSIGAVYFANQISFDRSVALKVLTKEYSNTKGIDSFLKEARAAAKLSHPNLVQSLGVGEEEGVCFMAMTFIEGETVKDKIKREGRINVDEALHIVQQVAEGLHFAWMESGLIHRDVKPENIMLSKEGTVRLTDLGLAISESEWHEDMEISGSPSYMSPEQFTGEKIDTRSDIYSLGISLYQMISGKLPFSGSTLKTVARQHFYDPPKPLNKIDPLIPVKVSNLVRKMVEKEPIKRFQNMEELIREIWEVRQTTAPDKDLVPGVHTISIRRLDYDLQKLSKEREEHIKVEKTKESISSAVLARILIIGTPVLLSVGIVFWVIISHRNEERSRNARLVNALGTMIDDTTSDVPEVEVQWNRLYKNLPSSKYDFDRELRTRMLYFREKIRNRRLSDQLTKAEEQISNIREEVSSQLEGLIEDNRKKAEMLEEKQREFAVKEQRLNLMALKTSDTQEESGRIIEEKNRLEERLREVEDLYQNSWQNSLLVRVYAMASRGKAEAAKVFLKSENARRPGNEEWIEAKMDKLDQIRRFEEQVASSGSKYADIFVADGRIRNIIGGMVELITPTGAREIPLTSLSVNDLLPIARDVFPGCNDKDLYEFLLIMTDSMSQANNLPEVDSQVQKWIDAICDQRIDRIRNLSFVDEKKAREQAKEFIKEFENTPGMNEKFKPELRKIFQKDLLF
ncbi:MAG: protein kinase [Victivallales bacterium]|nr:protein kinase [Victivallales bacterium]